MINFHLQMLKRYSTKPLKHYYITLFIILFLVIPHLQSTAQAFSATYYTGSYYMLDNTKYTGLLGLNPDPPLRFKSHPDNVLYFKQDKDAVVQKVPMSNLNGFFMKTSLTNDTFAIVHNSKSSRIKFKNDCIEVLYRKGPVNLYDYRIMRRGGVFMLLSEIYVDNYYYYGSEPDSAIEMSNKDFEKIMSEMLADDPEIVAMIHQKEYKMSEMFKLLKEYYSRHSF